MGDDADVVDAFQRLLARGQQCRRTRGEMHIATFRGKAVRTGQANALRCASDEDGFTGEAEVHEVSFCRELKRANDVFTTSAIRADSATSVRERRA